MITDYVTNFFKKVYKSFVELFGGYGLILHLCTPKRRQRAERIRGEGVIRKIITDKI